MRFFVKIRAFFAALKPSRHQSDRSSKIPQEKPAPRETEQIESSPIKTNKKGKTTDIKAVGSEINLEKSNVFTVSNYRAESRTLVIKNNDGLIQGTVTIGKTIDNKEVGVLTVHHFKLTLALLELWEKAGRPRQERVHFTILKLLKRLGLTDGGSNYQTIKRHLVNLREIPIRFQATFELSNGSFQTLQPFSILSSVYIYERTYKTKNGQRTRGYGDFRFDDHILMNLLDNYCHPLILDVITKFKQHKDLAILLYTYIDRKMAFRTSWQRNLKGLFDDLDLPQENIKYPSVRKHKIEPALEEIRQRGRQLSTGRLSSCRIVKTAEGDDYKLVCRKIPRNTPIDAENRRTDESLIVGNGKTSGKQITTQDWANLSLEELLKKTRE